MGIRQIEMLGKMFVQKIWQAKHQKKLITGCLPCQGKPHPHEHIRDIRES